MDPVNPNARRTEKNMMDKLRNLIAILAAVGAALPWWWIIPSALALLGVAGSATATKVVSGWMTPALMALSVVLLSRSFYVLYVQKRGTRPVKVLTWLSALFVAGFWTWHFFLAKR
jgi:hypothetical protein